jgi:hypothetical protein
MTTFDATAYPSQIEAAKTLRDRLLTGPLHATLPPLDRYCFMACDEQRETGECDCTRRIKRDIEAEVAAQQ